MSNEGRSPKGRGPQHTTHHDDCGCLSARYEARLDAQRAATASLEALNRKHAEMYAKEIDRHEAQIAALKHDEATLLEDNDYLRQRIAALEAERGEWRAAAGREIAVAYAHANALRDALDLFTDNAVKCRNNELGEDYLQCGECDGQDWGSDPDCFDPDKHYDGCKYKPENLRTAASKALAQTPAQSLAAHDAEVLERAARACEAKTSRPAGHRGQWEGYGGFEDDMTGPECAKFIRALAAHAATPCARCGGDGWLPSKLEDNRFGQRMRTQDQCPDCKQEVKR